MSASAAPETYEQLVEHFADAVRAGLAGVDAPIPEIDAHVTAAVVVALSRVQGEYLQHGGDLMLAAAGEGEG